MVWDYNKSKYSIYISFFLFLSVFSKFTGFQRISFGFLSNTGRTFHAPGLAKTEIGLHISIFFDCVPRISSYKV